MKRMVMIAMLMLGAAPAFAAPASGLAPELKTKVQATHARYKDQIKAVWQDARAAREALKAEMAKAQPDDATLVQLEERLAGDRQQLQALRAQAHAELKKQLTPKEYAQLILARGEHFGRRMHQRGSAPADATQ